MPANLDRIRLWVEALESGEFQQGRHVLTEVLDDGSQRHCCLGVACIVAMRNGVQVKAEESEARIVDEDLGEDVERDVSVIRYDGQSDLPPQKVMGWFGLTENPRLRTEGQHLTRSASDLNDTERYTFEQIAQAIRLTYLEDGS